MSDYQVRKDIDRLISEVYDSSDNSLNLVPFGRDSELKGVYSRTDGDGNPVDVGALDTIFEKYGLFDIDKRVDEIERRLDEVESRLDDLEGLNAD